MNWSRLEVPLVTAGLAYLVAVAWMMANTSFDLWGAFVIGPVLGVAGLVMVRRMFPGPLRPLAVVLSWGLLAKLAGTLARYWVGFEAYGGAIDAGRYHDYADVKLTAIRQGAESWWGIVPTGQGTQFIENLTAFVYVPTGPTKLGGFLIFGFLGFVGVLWFVKAAVVAVPGLAKRRYAALCAFAPSLIYWPSSIGKDAWMTLTLGFGTYGLARLLARQGVVSSLAMMVVGVGLAAVVRPHIALLWVAGGVAALFVASMRGRGTRARAGGHLFDRVLVVLMLGVAVVGLLFMSRVTLRYLDFSEEDASTGDAISAILAETTRRTEQGSSFEPPRVDSVADWPYASLRTIIRPLPYEVRGVAQVVTALELAALWLLFVWWWGRTKYLPWAVFAVPYVAFAMATLFLGGLAFSSFANLGVLARQKSIIFPLLLLIPCVPAKPKRPSRAEMVERPLPERRDAELARSLPA